MYVQVLLYVPKIQMNDGFAGNPIGAMFLWNKNIANDYNKIAKDKLKTVKKLF